MDAMRSEAGRCNPLIQYCEDLLSRSKRSVVEQKKTPRKVLDFVMFPIHARSKYFTPPIFPSVKFCIPRFSTPVDKGDCLVILLRSFVRDGPFSSLESECESLFPLVIGRRSQQQDTTGESVHLAPGGPRSISRPLSSQEHVERKSTSA